MELYSSDKHYKLYHGNMLDMGQVIESWTIDSIVTDPPYELNFMWKGWDNSWIAFQPDTWKKCLEVLKPWGYLLAFWGSRTYHRIACAIEDAGFEIRDCIMWLYGSWFPKSMALDKSIEWKLTTWSANKTEFKNLDWTKEESWNWGISKMSKEQWFRNTDYTEDNHLRTVKVEHKTELWKKWNWWGTALKPSYEPIIVARKPLEWSCTDNVIKYGVGGINIDECRVPFEDTKNPATNPLYRKNAWYKLPEKWQESKWAVSFTSSKNETSDLGRFPANTILTYWDDDREEVCSGFPNSWKWNNKWAYNYAGREYDNSDTSMFNWDKPQAPSNYNDSGSAARYFKNCNFSLRDLDQWKQLYVSNAEKSLEILSETIESIVPISADMLLWMLKDLNVKYAENQLDLWEIHIVPDIVEMLTYDFRKEGLQAILDFIGNYKNCIQLQSLVQFVEKCDSIDTTQTTQNLLKLFGYVRAAITKYTQTIKNEEQKRYIYTPKASKRDRDEGLGEFEDKEYILGYNGATLDNIREKGNYGNGGNGLSTIKIRKNTHPTVKPTDLMQYLVRLVTPNGWTVLDPFNWSGSTWKAVMYENKDRNKNYKYIWIELTEEYLPIAKARIEYVLNTGGDLKEVPLF